MRILLDECVNPRVRSLFAGHEVKLLAEFGWRAISDADLVRRVSGSIDLLITLDRGFEFEHNLARLTFGILIVHVTRNRIEDYQRLSNSLIQAVEAIRPGEVIHVG